MGGGDLSLKFNAARDLFLRMLKLTSLKKLKISKFRVHGSNFSTLKKKEMQMENDYIDMNLGIGKRNHLYFPAKILVFITKMYNIEMIRWKIRNCKTSTF